MKLIIQNQNCVYYGDEAHSFSDGHLVVGSTHYTQYQEGDIEVIENPENVPSDFSVFKYLYIAPDFVVTSDYTEVCEEQRTERNTLLKETDWWAVSDRTMTQAETDYRQALRNVPQQDGFPTDITWPTKP
jgi:hypothetical protein